MNRYALEKALWDVVSHPDHATALREGPEGFLGRYCLSQAHADMLRQMDVQALLALQINPMLVMRAFQMVHGRDQLPEYLRRLAHPAHGATPQGST